MRRVAIPVIWAMMIVILVFTTSLYAAYAINASMTTRSPIDNTTSNNETLINNTTSNNETLINNNPKSVAIQDDTGDTFRKTVNLEVINQTEIPTGKIQPEFIASLIDANRASSNPHFILIDNKSGIIGYGLPSYWKLSSEPCTGNFTCKANVTTSWGWGLRNNMSLQVSTKSPTGTLGAWSWIRGQDIGVNPNERYELVTHMKLNQYATQSHVALRGYNESSKSWYHLTTQCPSGTNGPLEWHEFSCELTIPENTTKIRPALNAGWTSQPNKEATTWFDDVYMIRR